MEWQLACSDLSSVRRWLTDHGTVGDLLLEPRSTLQIFDTYLDTDDWRIHRAGYALRIRCESGRAEATLKSLHSASTEVADRRELSEALESASSESIRQSVGPVGTRVQAVSGSHDLIPLFEVRTSRQRFGVRRLDEAAELGEIALDDTVISRPQGEPRTTIQRVEVEALTDAHEPLLSLVKTLRRDCALEPAADNKFSQGLKSVGLAPGSLPDAPLMTVHRSMTLFQVALANLRRCLYAWHLHEPGARLGDDPEELHDLRLAGRRLDALLRQFRSVLSPALMRSRPLLKRALRALGEVRDLDVALVELAAFGGQLSPADRETLEPLKRHLMVERDRARERMLTVLDSRAVQDALERLTTLLAVPAVPTPVSVGISVRSLAPDLIRRRYRKVRKGADLLTADSSTEAYHAVRGQVKRLRYALEAVAVIYGKPADEMLRALRRWQETLGSQQDAAVAGRRLQAIAMAPPKGVPPGTVFLMGRLAEHYAGVAARARRQMPKNYRRVRARWKRLRLKFARIAPGDPPAPAPAPIATVERAATVVPPARAPIRAAPVSP